MKKILLLFALFGVAFSQMRDDGWIDSGQMLRFPASRFFTAVGVGNSEVSARENAVVEVRRQISATIKSEQISKEFSMTTNNSAVDTSVLSIRNRISVVGDIAGVEIIATALRENRHFAFAALEKEKFTALQRMKIAELQSDLIRTNNLADKAIKENEIALAISHLNSANAKISAIQNERLLLSAAAVLTASEEIPVSRAEIDGKLAQIFNSIRMKADGDFSVAVSANNKPVENLALALFDERNRKITSARTDKNGFAQFSLGTNAPTSRGTHNFTARIDLEQAQNLPVAEFSYIVKMKNLAAQISVSVSTELRSAASSIERAVKEMFANHGITNDKNAAAKISVSVSDLPAETIEGLSASRTFVRSNAVVLVSISGAESGKTFSASFENSGMGNNRAAAVSDGVRKIKFGADLSEIQNAVE